MALGSLEKLLGRTVLPKCQPIYSGKCRLAQDEADSGQKEGRCRCLLRLFVPADATVTGASEAHRLLGLCGASTRNQR